MLALRAILALALAAAVSALPTDMVAEESGVSQWNEGAIAIGMFSGGRRRRAGDDGSSGPTPQRQRRQEDLSEDFSADEYDDDGDLDMKKKVMRMRRQAPRRGIESPFGPTSDVEDRVRRAAQDSSQEHGLEDNDHVDNDHFPTEDEGKRTRRTSEDAYFDDSEGGDDDDEVTIDLAPFAPKKKRQVVGQDVATDDDEDVYRDLDDQPLPVWARGTRDGRQRRQLDQAMPSMDDDQPDYIRESRDLETATAASSTEGSDAAIQAPERDQTTAGPVKAANTATEESGEKAVESVTTEVPQEGGEKLTTTTTPAPTSSSTHTIDSVMRDDESGTAEAGSSSSLESPSSEADSSEQPLRARRAPQPQRGRFDGFVLSDFSGFRSGRSVRARRSEPSEAALIKTLLEAPIDESILGELPVRRLRQITEAMPQPASGGPVTYLVPLVAPQPPSAQDEDAVNDAVPQKVLQIYTAHQPVPVVAEMIPTTTTTAAPPPAEPLVPVLVPESAVSGILVPDNVPVRVEVIPPDAAPAADQPVVVQPALLQPAVPVAQPTPVQHPDATMPTQHSPQQAQPLLVLQPGPVIIDPVTPVSPVKPQAPQGQQVPLEIPQEVSLTKQEAPQAAKDAALAPVVVSQTAHTVAVPEGADAGSATQPDGPIPMPSPQEPLAQPAPLEWFPAAPMNPAPFEAQNQAPPRQHFDVNLTPSVDTSRWTATVPILEKTIQLHPDGSYVYSYETADGVRVAEAGVLKEVPVRPEEGSAKAAVPATVLANSVQGGYSYTAPDGTYVSLRYVADENGFQPVLGESLPTANKNKARAAVRFDENK